MDEIALKVAPLLANGSGGFDWAGLPILVEWLGISDVDGLLLRLAVIRKHRPRSLTNDE